MQYDRVKQEKLGIKGRLTKDHKKTTSINTEVSYHENKQSRWYDSWYMYDIMATGREEAKIAREKGASHGRFMLMITAFVRRAGSY